jgi:hypothetical protein
MCPVFPILKIILQAEKIPFFRATFLAAEINLPKRDKSFVLNFFFHSICLYKKYNP